MSYVPLRVMSDFSMGIGASKISAIAGRMAAITSHNDDAQIKACALSDLVSLSGALDFSKSMASKGVKPLIGCRYLVKSGDLQGDIIVIAATEVGFIDMGRMLSTAYRPTVSKRNGRLSIPAVPVITLDDLIPLLSANVIVLSGAAQGGFAAASLRIDSGRSLERLALASDGRFYVEICRTQGIRDASEPELLRFSDGHNRLQMNFPIVATTDCRYAERNDAIAYEMLSFAREERSELIAIDLQKWREDARLPFDRRRLHPLPGQIPVYYHIPDDREFNEWFADLPDAINNTRVIAFRASFMVEEKPQEPPRYEDVSGIDEDTLLAMQAREGLAKILRRYHLEDQASVYHERLEFELSVIQEKRFSGYFLTVSDFVSWARDNGVIVGDGRGSGAGSLVAWSMRITNVNPLPYGLLFERFLNPERTSMPDFDVDFDPVGRERVIDYVRKKYGDDHVCAIAAFSALRGKKAIALAAKATQMVGSGAVGSISFSLDTRRKVQNFLPPTGAPLLDLAKLEEYQNVLNGDDAAAALHRIAVMVDGLFVHQTRHAAGIVISSRPLADVFPVIRDRKDIEMPLSSYDMKGVEKVGAVKFDFLGLSNLSVIGDTLRLLKQDGYQVEMPEEYDDPAVFSTIRSGMTIGIFQLGGRGMVKAIQKVKPDSFVEIAAISALYRPGPMQYIESFALRKLGKEVVKYPLENCRAPDYVPVAPLQLAVDAVADDLPPDVLARLRTVPKLSQLYRADGTILAESLMARGLPVKPAEPCVGDKVRELLAETNGYFVYQEQIMIAALIVSGFSYAQADIFRRAIGKKDRNTLEGLRMIFFEGCLNNGVSKDEAEGLYNDFAMFADYGFNKSHAIAYSMISYQTAWLKTYYPDYFYAAVLADKRGDKTGIATIMDEMSLYGVGFALPDVNMSRVEARAVGAGLDMSREDGYCLLGGLADIVGLGESAALTILLERFRSAVPGDDLPGGPFRSIVDFWRRTRSDVSGMTTSQIKYSMTSEDEEDAWVSARTGAAPLPGLNDRHYRSLVEAGALDHLPYFTGGEAPDPTQPANRQRIALILKWLAQGKRGNIRQDDLFAAASDGGYVLPDEYDRRLLTRGAKGTIRLEEVADYRNRLVLERDAVGYSAANSFLISQSPRLVNAGFRLVSGIDHISRTLNLRTLPNMRVAVRVLRPDTSITDDRVRRHRFFLATDGMSFLTVTGMNGDAVRALDDAAVVGRPVALFGEYSRQYNSGTGRVDVILSVERVIDAELYLNTVQPSPDIVVHMRDDIDQRRFAMILAEKLKRERSTANPFGGQVILAAEDIDSVSGGLMDGCQMRTWRIADGPAPGVWPVTDHTSFSTSRNDALLFEIDDDLIAEIEAMPEVSRVVLPVAANMRCSLGHPVYIDTGMMGGFLATEAAWEKAAQDYFPAPIPVSKDKDTSQQAEAQAA